jgi:thymidylate synthase (FAD)
VLDDGFVRVVDYMGDDGAIVQAARVSYGKGTKRVQEDRGLIRYLLRHAHTTPFEMCEIKLHVRVPMDVWRQWIRHRTASVNEYSTRYSEAIDAAQRTPPDAWRLQSTGNRQGSSGYLSAESGSRLSEEERRLQRQVRDIYEARLAAGVAREQARKDLPLSTYTEAYWKVDLHNLLHFLDLRMDEHAQEEIRAYANVIGEQIVAKWVPVTWEAFLDYRRHATRLSRIESAVLTALASGDGDGAIAVAQERGLLERGDDGCLKANRERKELEEKLARLGLRLPWE